MSDKIRTLAQNRALHLCFKQLANLLNESGIDYTKLVIKADIPWSSEMCKELIWRPVQKAYSGTESTTKLKTTDIDAIFSVIIKSVSELTGQTLEWPSIESLMMEKTLKEN